MAIKSNPSDWVTRWRSGVSAAGGRYTAGIQATTNWAAATTAPSAVQARNAGLQAAMNNGSIEAGIQRVGDAGWKAATVAKAGNWATGVNSPIAQQRAQLGATKLFGMLGQAESALANMPRGGYAENKARLNTWVDAMHAAALAAKGQ